MPNDVFIIGAGVGGLTTGALLAKKGYSVKILEKSSKLGGRTASLLYKNHILDNGFHIMPFYKKSAIFEVLKSIGIESRLKLAKVDDIAFHSDTGFHKYPKGMGDLLQLSLIPMKSRIRLLKLLLPMAFTSIKKTEEWDDKSLTEITKKLDDDTKAFFEAVCMLAFADTADHISLGEFARTIIRANPFKGGTSEFAYPDNGGYDSISHVLADYIIEKNGKIETNQSVKKIVITDSKVTGIITKDDSFFPTDCVVISYPAYMALNQLFDEDIIDKKFIEKINRLDKKTAVVEVHFALNSKIDSRQVVFPVGEHYVTKGIFFISNITPSVSPSGEHLIIAGTPVDPSVADDSKKIKQIVQLMKTEISSIYPDFNSSLLWERPMAWKLVESVVKEPGMVWKSKMPHQIPGIEGLFFVGDSTVSYGIGTDSAAHSSILCRPKIESFLQVKK
ncbi:FAD-dependent oxidoreductase [Candidatus Nitrosopumilus sp. SW]|uniref:phytoene desaturase family protein n=1 Tax=Candidatus Nitrosopumilus sp. SW TaxID=2508726 RepID=UPI00114F6D75|nr:FAD-dependent oxidoreductase [Candidatus Nitrosopumilus sp. SW]QDI89569.1 FAD-dependent oxidoreductase [Candidatus Nitrosopumilus sp. SW]